MSQDQETMDGNRERSGTERVFLSYSSHNKGEVEAVRTLLAALGHRVWFDRNIEYGTPDHWPAVVRAIDESGIFLLLVSKASLDSEHVLLEWLRAAGEKEAHESLGDRAYNLWFSGHGSWPSHSVRARVVVLEDLHGDFGKFKATWRQLPQAPDRGEAAATPEKAAWTAAVALSAQDSELEQALADACSNLKQSLSLAQLEPDEEGRDQLIRERVLPAIVEVWLAENSITVGSAGLDLDRLCSWEAPDDSGPWNTWHALAHSVRELRGRRSAVELDDLQALKSVGAGSVGEALKGLPVTPVLGWGREPSRYDLVISERRLADTYPDTVSRWLDLARIHSQGIGLTFLVGPETVHAGQEEMPIDVSAITSEAAFLGGLDDQGEAELEAFFEGLIRANEGQRVVDRATDRSRVVRAGDDELGELRSRLLLLAHRANKSFVERRKELETPISVDGWMTPVELNDGQLSELTRLIDKASELLARWVRESGAGGTFAPTLGSRALGEALDTLKADLNGAGRSLKMSTRAPIPHLLSAESVQWLADVFWHSLVHSIPVYPSATELVIQATLMHDSSNRDVLGVTKPPARAGYRQIWPSRSVEKLGNAIADAMELPWKSGPSCRGLFRELALALRGQFSRGGPGEVFTPEVSPRALAVSFAFDLELESALAATGDGVYHVAFPIVEVQEEKSGPRPWGDWHWAIATFKGPGGKGTGGGRRIREELLACVRVPQQWAFLTKNSDISDLRGPLVLKLSGAPLLTLEKGPEASGTPSGVSRAESWRAQARRSEQPPVRYYLPMAMGDYDNMQFLLIDLIANSQESKEKDLVSDAAMPGWLMSQLASPGRRWLGIGISEQDWNMRMQLFVHASRANQASIAALFSDSQPGREAFLRSCGIQPVTGSLEALELLLQDLNRRNGDE